MRDKKSIYVEEDVHKALMIRKKALDVRSVNEVLKYEFGLGKYKYVNARED